MLIELKVFKDETMNKTLLVAGAAAIAVSIAPKFIAQSYQSTYHEIWDKVGANPNITITQRNYNGHWFTGETSTTIAVELAPGEKPFEITFDEILSFGPIVFQNGSMYFTAIYSDAELSFDENIVDKALMQQINEKLDIKSTLGFSGEYTTELNAQAFDYSDENVQLSVGELRSTMTLIDERRMVGNLDWKGLTASTIDAKFNIEGLSATFDQFVHDGTVYDMNAVMAGNADFNVTSFHFTDLTSNAIVAMKGLKAESSVDIEENLMSVSVDYSANEITTPVGIYSNGLLAMVIANLEITVMKEISEQLSKLPSPDAPEYTQAFTQVGATAVKLLEQEPTIKITQLTIDTPQGKISSDAEFSLDKNLVDMQNPTSLVVAAKALAKAKAPEAFLANYGMQPMIDSFVQQGFVTKEQGDIAVNATFQRGQLLLNGKPLQM